MKLSEDEDFDTHEEVYGKKAKDIKYSEEKCPICNSRIDEFGYCACGAVG